MHRTLALARHDPCYLAVQLLDVDDLARVLRVDVRPGGDVVAVLRDRAVVDERREVVDISARRERVEDPLLVFLDELVLVAPPDELPSAMPTIAR